MTVDLKILIDQIRHKPDIRVVVLLILGISVFHAPGLLPGQTFLPVDLTNHILPWRSDTWQPLQNWLISDPLYQFYPFLDYNVRAISHNGQWPLWNPYILLGHPSLADPLAQPFYPFFIGLGLILGTARGLALGLWLHAVLAAVTTYGFLRTIRCRRYAAATGAFTYALGGYLVTWFETPFWISTLAWLPAILWAFELAVRRRSLRFTALSAAAMTLTILGGQVSFALTIALFLGFYALGRTIEAFRRKEEKYAWPLIVVGIIVGLGAMTSAIQILPFAEFLGISHRAVEKGLANPLPLKQLITLIVPYFYGSPTTLTPYWGAINFAEGTIYAGLPVLILASLAPFVVRRFFVVYLSLLTIAITLFVVGAPGVQELGVIPILKYLSLHRTTFLLPMLLAILAAFTLSESQIPLGIAAIICASLTGAVGLVIYGNWTVVQGHWQELETPLLRAGLLAIATMLFLVVRQRLPSGRRLAEWGLLGLVFLDLFTFGSRFNPTGPISELVPSKPAIDYLGVNSGTFRVAAIQASDVLFGPNLLSLYNVAEAGGYSSFVSARFRELVAAGNPEVDIPWMDRNRNMITFSRPPERLLDLLGVAYIASPKPLADPGVRAELDIDNCDHESAPIGGAYSITGSFFVHDTAINRLDLRFRVREPAQMSGEIRVRMWRGLERQRLVLDTQLSVSELRDREPITLYFAPEKEAPGQTYTWEIATAEATRHTGISLCTTKNGQPGLSVYGASWSQVYAGKIYIWERLAPLPRAYVVHATEQIDDDARAINRLLDEEFDLRNVAITAEPTGLPYVADMPATQARIVTYEATRVEIEATTSQQGLLILGDQYHPGWRASVDGQPTPILRANHTLRGVILPPGAHRVTFEFAPTSLKTGMWISGMGLALLVVLMIFGKSQETATEGPASGATTPTS